MPYRVVGPRGGAIIKSASLARLRSALPSLVKRFKKVTVTAVPAPVDRRALLVKLARELIAHEPEVHYAERRPMQTVKLKQPKYPMTMDCSESVTCLYKWAGLPDPNGAKYNGTGYTGTLLSHGRRIPAATAKPGDLAVFGPGTGNHVCMVLEPGADPLLFSHGQEKGPLAIRLSEEQQAQKPPVTFLSFLQ